MFQEFAIRFVRGDFRTADPKKGRFRDFLKTTLIVDHQRRRQRRFALALGEQAAKPAPPAPAADESECAFLEAWRCDLIHQAWIELERFQTASGIPLHTVLRYRTDHPAERSQEMARSLESILGKRLTAEWVRILQ